MTRIARTILLACACMVATTAPLRADSITLKSGKTLEGIIRQLDGGYEITLADGKREFVAIEDVKSIRLTNEGKVNEGDARERLSSLQRSVESERSIERIIERYEQFISMNADTAAARQAQADLDEWRGRLAKQMVKVGRRWLTPAERDADLLATAEDAGRINALFAAGKADEAAARIRVGLELNPENVTYQYLNGVLQMKRGQWTDARRSFEMVSRQIGDHPPTLVNQAVLAVQFKRWPSAVTDLEQAMAIAPGNREIIDNVLEFTRLAPANARRGTTWERLMTQFNAQEADLARRMAAEHQLYRWGSSWVDQARLDEVKRQQEAYEAKKAALAKDFNETQEQSRQAGERIAMIERVLRQMESDSVVVDPITGRVVRRAYPPAYYEMQRDLDRVRNEKAGFDQRLNDLRRQAIEVEATAPKPPYAGKLSPIDERGVPVVMPRETPPTPPATAPSTQPDGGWRPPMLPG